MLVVTRKIEEGIIIDENIEITVLGIEDGRVKLGIQAPKDKKIYRQEIYQAVKQENQQAIHIHKNILNRLPKKQ
ncbi:carbon storage regulator CsrA [Garciella nitratireducens]|uniref:Translational regulator CsrA n=1 Tax=Garciella nitratireducens DSM 15102 TaxID=1121911 RepID=A0A1T4LF56_9FIRM|nr:carbon storage regulator CsrA [Garciella nitratireducens]RBP46776.1 carbon storage regulator CsrA [Garciella nitratireducens]SJZ53198.1 carbon storage regulator, CsrA [Garciella nitratireducens DSM 15102]